MSVYTELLRLTSIVGQATDPDVADRLHDLQHGARIEYLVLSPQDTLRHRFRGTTDVGTEVAVMLPRDAHLCNGAVLLLDTDRAVVVRMREQPWLGLSPRDAAAALELGYFAGNMHWKVRFEGHNLWIALAGPEWDYLSRLADFLADGRATRVAAEA